MNSLLQVGYDLLDKGAIPDFILRRAIRALLRQRLREINHGSFEANHAAKMKWIQEVKARENIADVTEKPNEQLYEVPTKFVLSALGPFAKYSSCLYPTGKESLAEAEVLMMESYCEKAQLRDGLDVLDLGCGWGSLTLFLAEKYPNSRFTGISNSSTQKKYIEAKLAEKGLTNVTIITADVNTFDFTGPDPQRFDRILSIEMFEHMKNYEALLRKVSTWLKTKTGEDGDDAVLFVHIFCHKTTPYHFVEDDGWMAKNFFSGGTMPSHDLFLYFQNDLALVQSWYISGTHYAQTLEAWLKQQDANKQVEQYSRAQSIIAYCIIGTLFRPALLARPDGLKELEADAAERGVPASEATKTFNRFRVFYMACAELFNMNEGQEWGVGHYLFKAKA